MCDIVRLDKYFWRRLQVENGKQNRVAYQFFLFSFTHLSIFYSFIFFLQENWRLY